MVGKLIFVYQVDIVTKKDKTTMQTKNEKRQKVLDNLIIRYKNIKNKRMQLQGNSYYVIPLSVDEINLHMEICNLCKNLKIDLPSDL